MKECPKCEFCYADEVNFCPRDQTPTYLSLPGGQLLANRYFLEKRLGRGAMGQVYLANDKNLGTRRVAVKTIRQDILNSDDLQEGEAIVRFEREAMAAASIHHPHIVDVTDFGESSEGIFYLVMEYVEGETLHQLLRREGTLPVKRAVKLLRQIADGVEAAHEAGILHRDLKPANIFIKKGKSGDDGFVKVGDFGLAKIVNQTVGDANSKDTPSSRGIVGTPEFMSPEQMQPELGVDTRSDVYALGTIAYLMLGGRTPFSGDLMQLIMQKVMHPPPLLSTLRSDIPKDVEKVIMIALETKSENRSATVSDWISELESATENIQEEKNVGISRLVILAPVNAEVYVDDERKGSVGSSGRLVLSSVPAGRHVLRVSNSGEKDDERVIEIREDADEQVIQAKLKPLLASNSQPTSLNAGNSGTAQSSLIPEIVACTNCEARFAEGVKFCGRCGNRSFYKISEDENKPELSCPRCAETVSTSTKFCGRCGLNIEQSGSLPSSRVALDNSRFPSNSSKQVEKTCGRCGKKTPANAKFCGFCANNLT
ncbi:MAG TPA: protein kinase [Pyrinomonadaceae bacterium]|nr:protein kinase [Pyrinomonadaceae bacterium]